MKIKYEAYTGDGTDGESIEIPKELCPPSLVAITEKDGVKKIHVEKDGKQYERFEWTGDGKQNRVID